MAWRDARGVTLPELLVATAVLGLLMAGLLGLLQAGTAGYRWGTARTEAQQAARVALDRMARELREASQPTGDRLPEPSPAGAGA